MKKILLIAIIAIFSGAGCSDFLTEDPILSQSNQLTLADYTGLSKSVHGAYSPLVSPSWYGAAFVLDAEMRSGNGKINIDYSSGRYTVSYNLNYNSTSTSGLWGYAYYVISAVNNVLANLEGKENAEVSTQDLNNLRAECLFLRALSHFDLVRTYAKAYTVDPQSPGVPYVFVTDPAGLPARNTVKEVYDNIVKDLTDAEGFIDPKYVRSGVADAKSVVSKPAIQALLARVYLYMENWQKAADYATLLINNSAYKLWTKAELADVWKADKPTSGEVIFEVYGLKSNSYDGYWDAITWQTKPDGYADCAASDDIRLLYAADDERGKLFRPHPDDDNAWWTTKYIGKDFGTPDVSNTIVLRLSEMYLNRAEALAHGAVIPGGATALSDLNTLRAQRGASPLGSASPQDALNERRLELAWEGHLWFDCARTKTPITRTDYVGAAENKDIPANSKYWALPIPKRELDVNPNLSQNPGYEN
jgi:hypothetical protein